MIDDFDGRVEIDMRLERGASYGLSKVSYSRLAQAAISASRLAGIEPAEICKLANGEPGCEVVLYGSHSAYTVKVEAIGRIALAFLPLDSSKPEPQEILSGSDDWECWRRLVYLLLKLEDYNPATVEEAEAFMRAQGIKF